MQFQREREIENAIASVKRDTRFVQVSLFTVPSDRTLALIFLAKSGTMLEGPSYLVSRELPSCCEHESVWVYNAFQVIELANGKRGLLGDRERMPLKKSSKPDVIKTKETAEGCHGSGKSAYKSCNRHNNGDQSDNKRDRGEQSDSSSLIHQIGRDISINCLLRCSRSDYGSIASLNQSFRSLIRSGELYKLRQKFGIIEHWVYISCELLEWEAFDPIRLRWMHLPRMTSNECFRCSDKESLAVGTELLVFGKEIMSPVVYKYSILTNSWTLGAGMNEPRCLFGSASLGNIAIVAGGCDPRGNILRSVELYNSDTGTWMTLPSMNRPRKLCSAVFMDGKFFVMGGIGVGNPNLLTCGEVYDLKTRTWHEIPDMFPPFSGDADATGTAATSKAPPLLAVVKNELYAANHAEKELRRYDKRRNLWVTVGSLPEQVSSMDGWGLAFRGCGDQLIVIGGPRAVGGGTIEVNAWVPDEHPPQWNLLGSKHSGSFVYNCAVMGC